MDSNSILFRDVFFIVSEMLQANKIEGLQSNRARLYFKNYYHTFHSYSFQKLWELEKGIEANISRKKSSTKSETSKLALSVNDFIFDWICFFGLADVLGRIHTELWEDKFKRLMSSHYCSTSADFLLFNHTAIKCDFL